MRKCIIANFMTKLKRNFIKMRRSSNKRKSRPNNKIVNKKTIMIALARMKACLENLKTSLNETIRLILIQITFFLSFEFLDYPILEVLSLNLLYIFIDRADYF